MSQRTLAAVIALCPCWWRCGGGRCLVPVPYVTYYPGSTVDMLGESGGKESIQVAGHRAYHDDGELRMTTVYVTPPQDDVSSVDAVAAPGSSAEEAV